MEDVRLYILMRTDVPSMNPGKAVAQGSHSANQCVFEAQNAVADGVPLDPKAVRLEQMLEAWQNQTPQGFGTCIVLGVTEAQLRVRVRMAQDSGHHAGITHDPTYPMATPPPPSPAIPLAGSAVSAVLMLLFGQPMLALLFAAVFTAIWVTRLATDAARSIRRHREPPVIPLDTCGYVFGPADEVKPCLIGLELMR